MNRNPCHGWANGDTVTFLKSDGAQIATGTVLVRKSAAGRWYLKVRIGTPGSGLGAPGEYVWPEGWVIGSGSFHSTCLECDQPYLTDDPVVARREFCQPCERREEKADAMNDSGIRNRRGFMYGARNKPEPPKPLTDEMRERIRQGDEEKARDEQESIF